MFKKKLKSSMNPKFDHSLLLSEPIEQIHILCLIMHHAYHLLWIRKTGYFCKTTRKFNIQHATIKVDDFVLNKSVDADDPRQLQDVFYYSSNLFYQRHLWILSRANVRRCLCHESILSTIYEKSMVTTLLSATDKQFPRR